MISAKGVNNDIRHGKELILWQKHMVALDFNEGWL